MIAGYYPEPEGRDRNRYLNNEVVSSSSYTTGTATDWEGNVREKQSSVFTVSFFPFKNSLDKVGEAIRHFAKELQKLMDSLGNDMFPNPYKHPVYKPYFAPVSDFRPRIIYRRMAFSKSGYIAKKMRNKKRR